MNKSPIECTVQEKTKLVAFLNNNGYITDIRRIPFVETPIDKNVDLELNPLPKYFLNFKWDFDSQSWVEASNEKDVTLYILEQKKILIHKIKEEASKEIENILPLYKQLNLIRENPNDPRFDEIDSIRVASNNLESQVNSFSTIKELRTFKISLGIQEDK